MAGIIEIPRSGLPTQRLQPLPTVFQPTPRTTAADFGGDIGEALSAAGEALGEAALGAAARRNEAAARSIDTGFAGELRTLLHDPERGYYATKGRAAVDAHTPTYQAITGLYDRHVALAANPAQQQMVRAVLDRRVRLASDGIAAHANREDTAWQDETRGARIDGAIADGVLSWQDPTQLRLHYNTGLQEALTQGGAEADPVAAETARRAYTTKFHAAIIGARIDADPEGARLYFDQHRDTLEPGAAAALDARLTLASERRRALDIAERAAPRDAGVVAFGPGPEPRRDDYVNSVRAEAENLPDGSPSLIQMAEAAAAKRHARDHTAWKQRRSEAINAAYEWADANPDASVAEMPMQVWSGLDPDTQTRVEGYVNSGGQVETDWQRYFELQDLAIEKPADFTSIDLIEEKSEIGDRDLDLLEILQEILRKGDPDNERLRLRTAKEMVDDVVNASGVKSNDPAVINLRRRFEEERTGFANSKHRQVNSAGAERALRHFASHLVALGNSTGLGAADRGAVNSIGDTTVVEAPTKYSGTSEVSALAAQERRADFDTAGNLLRSELSSDDLSGHRVSLDPDQLATTLLVQQSFDTDIAPDFTPVSNDPFHDLVVKDLVDALRAGGAVVVEEIPMHAIGTNRPAVPDIVVKGRNGSRYVIEVKTRTSRYLSEAQTYVFPLIELGDHVYTTDPRIRQLGLEPGQPLPPMCVYLAYAEKPGSKIIVFSLSGDPKCVEGLK